jgi:hypothetical protein
MTINAAEELSAAIRREIADVSVSIDAPAEEHGYWWIDLARGDRTATVEWRPERGFGVGLGAGAYGEGPDLILPTMDLAVRHVVDYLLSGPHETSRLAVSGVSTRR